MTENIKFTVQKSDSATAPVFRKKFTLQKPEKAVISVCGLGFAYYYINGKAASEDLFTAPVSDYTKTLWYNTYDVTELIKDGENTIAVICGNGWFNEEFNSSWGYNKAPWRGKPRFALQLICDGEVVLESGKGWTEYKSAVIYNQLRSGEYFDARLHNPDIFGENYEADDGVEADVYDSGDAIFRKCECEPIREDKVFPAVSIIKTGEKRYLYDIGQNISGYIRISGKCDCGDELLIRYAEDVTSENELTYNGAKVHYPESEYETDKYICDGTPFCWSPKFTYHGFRYIEISGIKNPEFIKVSGVFVHQDIKRRGDFKCSDELMNKIFCAGIYSTYSNMFYMMTDCPSREKLGWLNDTQMSVNQILLNFKAENMLEKWMYDIYDAMNENGEIPGIVPTSGWGYFKFGPVADGALFEMPYMIYLHTGDEKPLKESLPYFDRYFAYAKSLENGEGFITVGLGDHAAPNFSRATPKELVNAVLLGHFLDIAISAAKLCGKEISAYEEYKKKIAEITLKKYYREDRQCAAEDQTSVAMMICSGYVQDISQLKMQLRRLVGENTYHHNCGMVGLPYLYKALEICGLEDYIYKIITAKGFPTYSMWFEHEATTLFELWKSNPEKDKHLLIGSMNHHMYSDVLAVMKSLTLGIKAEAENPGFKRIDINPYFIKELDFAEGRFDVPSGGISVSWKRENGEIKLCIDIAGSVNAYYKSEKLITGKNIFIIKEERK